jgi:hypothetical protein
MDFADPTPQWRYEFPDAWAQAVLATGDDAWFALAFDVPTVLEGVTYTPVGRSDALFVRVRDGRVAAVSHLGTEASDVVADLAPRAGGVRALLRTSNGLAVVDIADDGTAGAIVPARTRLRGLPTAVGPNGVFIVFGGCDQPRSRCHPVVAQLDGTAGVAWQQNVPGNTLVLDLTYAGPGRVVVSGSDLDSDLFFSGRLYELTPDGASRLPDPKLPPGGLGLSEYYDLDVAPDGTGWVIGLLRNASDFPNQGARIFAGHFDAQLTWSELWVGDYDVYYAGSIATAHAEGAVMATPCEHPSAERYARAFLCWFDATGTPTRQIALADELHMLDATPRFTVTGGTTREVVTRRNITNTAWFAAYPGPPTNSGEVR